MIQYRSVKLKANWLGHPKGSILKINTVKADELISRKSAVEVKEEEMTEKASAPASKSERKEVKAPEAPKKDKQISRPVRAKAA